MGDQLSVVELVEDLRRHAYDDCDDLIVGTHIAIQAAELILSLQEQLARAREALADIQLHACNHGGWVENDPWAGICHIHEVATVALARSTLSPEPPVAP